MEKPRLRIRFGRRGLLLKTSEHQIQDEQRAVCEQYAAKFVAALGKDKSGFALSTKGLLPINGLRHPPAEDTTGWFLWCGEEFAVEPDFFAPLCTSHFYEDHPEISKFLGLPPGCRFLLAGEYADVWFDRSLLDV
jgi:hypothetical protein